MASEEVGKCEKKKQCGYNVGWKQKIRTENLSVVTFITNVRFRRECDILRGIVISKVGVAIRNTYFLLEVPVFQKRMIQYSLKNFFYSLFIWMC